MWVPLGRRSGKAHRRKWAAAKWIVGLATVALALLVVVQIAWLNRSSSGKSAAFFSDNFVVVRIPRDTSHGGTVSLVQAQEMDSLRDDDLRELAQFRPILELGLGSQRNLSNRSLSYIEPISELEIFSLCDVPVTDDGLKHLSGLHRLRKLTLTDCDNLTDGGLKHLGTLHGLKTFKVLECENLKGPGFRHLSNLKALGTLQIWYCGLREFSLSGGPPALRTINANNERLEVVSVSSLPSLSSLDIYSRSSLRRIVLKNLPNLTKAYVGSDAIEAPTEFELAELPALRELDLALPLNDHHIVQLGNLPGLRSLALSQKANWISDEAMEHIASLHALEVLHLGGEITDHGLSHLPELRNLKELSLRALPIKGGGLRWLSDLPRLQVLDLSATRVEGDALKWLFSIKSLRKVDLTQTDFHLRPAHVEALKKAMPWLQEVAVDH